MNQEVGSWEITITLVLEPASLLLLAAGPAAWAS